MDVLSTILLIAVPYILYMIIIKILENKFDLEFGKLEKNMIFFIIDILILLVVSKLS